MASGTTFANHRGVVPMLWVMVGLACTELVVVHGLLLMLWPKIVWPLSVATLLSIIWLIGWIRSWARLPHRLDKDVLQLHCGSLRSVNIPLTQITQVRSLQPGDLRQAGVRNIVPLAHPNRLIELAVSLPGRRPVDKIAIRLDDPSAFDDAMRAAGVTLLD